MWHVGVDLHRETIVAAAVDDAGQVRSPVRIACTDTPAIVSYFEQMRPFRVVIEATGTYRWLYNLLHSMVSVLLAHPLRLRDMTLRRTKTDRLDAQLLAQLLRLDQIPLAYIPNEDYQVLRDLLRYRAQLGRQLVQAKVQVRLLLARQNLVAPYKDPFGKRGLYWLSRQDLGSVANQIRDHAMQRLEWTRGQVQTIEDQMASLAPRYPQVEALLCLRGVGLYTALMIVGEFGDVTRFRSATHAAAYSGLTARVFQSGSTLHTGHISKQGSPYLRWILVEAAMKFVAADVPAANFYQRIRKRSGVKIARAAAGRKLAEISYKRLLRWHREHAMPAAAA